MIERFIDYLQFTAPIAEKSLQNSGYEAVAPIRFYKRGYRTENGVRYYFGNPNSSKATVIASGFALLFERYMFKNDAEMIDYWLSRGAIFSRLDLAVTDWIDTDFCTVADVETWYKSGLIESSFVEGGCKKIEKILPDAPNVPETLYIGDIEKRGKRGIFRAYDKGIEIGLPPLLATRLEVELKGDNANATARRIAKTNDIGGNFRAKFNVNSEQFDRLIDAPIADITRGESKPKREVDEKMDTRWNWLLETVAPALKQAWEHDRNSGAGDSNLQKFLIKAGVSGDIKRHATALVERILNDATEKIDLSD